MMNVTDYCNYVEQELTTWKARLFDVTNKIEHLSCGVKEKMLGNVGDLRLLLADMEERIKTLANECLTEWSPIKKEIDAGYVDMRSKYEETMSQIGNASPVSIPG